MIQQAKILVPFYTLALLPGWPVLRGLIEDGWYLAEMLHVSGIWSVYTLVATLAVTPAARLLGRLDAGRAPARWLLRMRRHLGLVSFVYGTLHLAHYVRDAGTLRVVLTEGWSLDYGTGWLGFGVMLALAATSNDRSVRRLGRNWKRLHRWVYPATAAIYLHWYLLETPKDPFWVWLGLVCTAKALHLALIWRARRVRTAPG